MYERAYWSAVAESRRQWKVLNRLKGFRKTVGLEVVVESVMAELLRASDEQVFGKIIHSQHLLLYNYLPPPSMASQNYDLRPRTHSRQLPTHSGHLTD